MADADAQLRVHFADLVRHAFDGRDAVVQVEDLAAAICLGLNRTFDEIGRVTFNDSLDRASIDGRGLDHTHCSGSCERHVQCARDWRGAECEDVDVGAQLLDAFLLLDAKALLLIDDQ